MDNKFIPLSVPNLKGRELEYVTKAVETEWVSTAGPFVNDFENAVASYVNVDKAVACQSGTAGLHIALQLCGVKPGDLVIVPTLSFIASANPIKYCMAEPVFMDCDDSLCIDPVKLRSFLDNECELSGKEVVFKKNKKRIAAIVVVHIFGNMADMESIMETADAYNIPVVEDAAEALGTMYESGKYAGQYAGTIGTIGVYSFNGNKIVTTGGGGMIVSKDGELLNRAKHLTTQAKADEVYFIHDEVGYNYRLTNLQAALGVAQLEQLDGFIEIKKSNYERYCSGFSGVEGIRMLGFRSGIRSNYWFYSLYMDDINPKDIIDYLTGEGIQSRPIWGLIHEQAPYVGDSNYLITEAVNYHKHVVNLPCSTNLSTCDVDRVIGAVCVYINSERNK